MRFFEIQDRIFSYYPEADTLLLEKAYVYAAKARRGKVRLNGEPYLVHQLAVAGILAQMRLDEESIVAGLLHDVVEDGIARPEELVEHFGPNIARIVQEVTKLGKLDFTNRKEGQAEYLRKMILAMSQDIRVVMVKLADRLNDLRSCRRHGFNPPDHIVQETLDIYAPLAARLGIDWMKLELEDLSFRYLAPQAYEEIVRGLEKTQEERRRYTEEVKRTLTAQLEEHGLKGRVGGRPKHLYSVYQKMMRQNLDLTRVFDLIAFRIITDSEKACYEALALVNAVWEPVPGRYKDYIVKPKSNMYRSLHTTVIGPYGERMEIQIRTEEMDKVANEGIAAHWLYKEGRPLEKVDEQETQRFSWLRELMEWNKDRRDPKAFFDAVRMNFYPDEVYVFTPQGDVKAFPKGATPVDFAYEVHTEVGHRCVGARVNGKLVPLRTELQNGDTIEILTSANHRPSKDWLKQVKTTKAINRIRQWFKVEEKERTIALGRDMCERDFRKKGLNFNNYINSSELLEAAKGFSLRSVDDLLAAIGYRKITPTQVMGKLPSAPKEEEPHKEEIISHEKRGSRTSGEGIRVRGVDDVLIRMGRCCNPVPGEPIVGYITRGRGVTVHRLLCRNLDKGDSDRQIDVQWDTGEERLFPVDVMIAHSGEKGILAAVSGVLGQLDARVVDFRTASQNPGQSMCRLRIEVKDTKHLQRVLSALRNEKGVQRVQRIMD